jgi:hypothetical protein
MVKEILIKVLIEKKIACYRNENLPLHQDCPYGKTAIDSNCNLCIRKREEIISVKTQEV